jgi:chemosensory pili system protein ChpA (sensor histidine kinase/response regulator)
MLRAGTTTYAVPSVMIDQVQEYKAQPVRELLAKGEVVWKDNRYPVRSLLTLLGRDRHADARTSDTRSSSCAAACSARRSASTRSSATASRGEDHRPAALAPPGMAGRDRARQRPGRADPEPRAARHREVLASEGAAIEAPKPAEAEFVVEESSGAPLVMVVDDSLTVRKITSRMLTREGYEVATRRTAWTHCSSSRRSSPIASCSTSRCRAWTALNSRATSAPTTALAEYRSS